MARNNLKGSKDDEEVAGLKTRLSYFRSDLNVLTWTIFFLFILLVTLFAFFMIHINNADLHKQFSWISEKVVISSGDIIEYPYDTVVVCEAGVGISAWEGLDKRTVFGCPALDGNHHCTGNGKICLIQKKVWN